MVFHSVLSFFFYKVIAFVFETCRALFLHPSLPSLAQRERESENGRVPGTTRNHEGPHRLGHRKIWNLTNCKIRSTLAGHSGYVNTVAVSPDGSLCASGGKDGVILLWDLAEGKRLYPLDVGSIVHALCFSPNRYWLCAATEASIKIWDLESKIVLVGLRVDAKQEAKMNDGGAAQSSGVKNKLVRICGGWWHCMILALCQVGDLALCCNCFSSDFYYVLHLFGDDFCCYNF